MAEKELNLFQFPAIDVAEFCARSPEIPRFGSFSLESDDEILRRGPKEAAAKLAREIGMNPDRWKFRKPGTNRAGGLAAAMKLTAEDRSERARKAAKARYAKRAGLVHGATNGPLRARAKATAAR